MKQIKLNENILYSLATLFFYNKTALLNLLQFEKCTISNIYSELFQYHNPCTACLYSAIFNIHGNINIS